MATSAWNIYRRSSLGFGYRDLSWLGYLTICMVFRRNIPLILLGAMGNFA